MGTVEVFDTMLESVNDKVVGMRHTVFLSDWAPGVVHSMNLWNLNDKISSLRWHTILDRQTFYFQENMDGGGFEYSNIKQWGKNREIPDLHKRYHGDKWSTFSWNSINPVKEKVNLIPIAHDRSCCSMLYNEKKGVDYSTQAQPSKIALIEPAAQEITVESTVTTITLIRVSLQSTL